MQLYESDKVKFTDDGRLLLTKIDNLPGLGGLRLCAKIARVATASPGSPRKPNPRTASWCRPASSST